MRARKFAPLTALLVKALENIARPARGVDRAGEAAAQDATGMAMKTRTTVPRLKE
jgi:hypothetical protein